MPVKKTVSALLANGFLVGEDELRFAPHQTLQEHFAARAVLSDVMQQARQGRLTRLLKGFFSDSDVLGYAADPWWSETFIQMAGLTDDPNTLARAVAGENPWLALWCVREGRAVDPETVHVIEAQSIALVHSENIRDRRRAAEALQQSDSLRVMAPLARLAVDAEDDIASIAFEGIQHFGEQAKFALAEAISTVNPHSSLENRARAGQYLSELGDPRPGVGLDSNGIPDIDWCEVSGGEFIYQDGEKRTLPAFKISRYPVTYAQYQAFLDAPDGYSNPNWWDGLHERQSEPGEQRFEFLNHPAENVSWYDAMAFCRWLSAKLGYAVRLPTEQEWEKAARGTDGREYPWGDGYREGYANINENFGNAGSHYLQQTSAVGMYPQGKSPCGALDMSGNVWEWCATDYENSATTYEREDLTTSARRVVRGGSWSYYNSYARAVSRRGYTPADRFNGLGCRLLCPPSHDPLK